MADAGGLQLLPQTRKKIALSSEGYSKLVLFGVAILVLDAAVYFGLLVYQRSLSAALATIDSQLAGLEQSRDTKREQQLLVFQQQLSQVSPLLTGHVVWSEALTHLEHLVQPKVQFISLVADANRKNFIIKGVADSYTTVARQVAVLSKDPGILDVSVSRISGSANGSVDFDMQVVFDPKQFIMRPITSPQP